MVALCQAQNGRLFFFSYRRRRTIQTQTNWQKVGTEAEGGAFKWTVGQKEEPLSGSYWTSWHEQKRAAGRRDLPFYYHEASDGNNEQKLIRRGAEEGIFSVG